MSDSSTILIHQALVANVLASWNSAAAAAVPSGTIPTTTSSTRCDSSSSESVSNITNDSTSLMMSDQSCSSSRRNVSVSSSSQSESSSSSSSSSSLTTTNQPEHQQQTNSRRRKTSSSRNASSNNNNHSSSSHQNHQLSSSSRPSAVRSRSHTTVLQVAVPLQTTPIQVIEKPRQYVNHSYNDFSTIAPDQDDDVSFLQDPSTKNIDELLFSQKLHHILTTRSSEFGKWARWLPHGRAFQVLHAASFEQHILPVYFGHKRYSTFLRQLDNYGFKLITHGPDRNSYYHECFLSGMPHLCKYMPHPRNARRKIPDPDNEPDLHKISKVFPLKDSIVQSNSVVVVAAPSRKRSSPVTIEEDIESVSEPAAKRLATDANAVSSAPAQATASTYSSSPLSELFKKCHYTSAGTAQNLLAPPSFSTISCPSAAGILSWVLFELQAKQQQSQVNIVPQQQPQELPIPPQQRPNINVLQDIIAAQNYYQIVG